MFFIWCFIIGFVLPLLFIKAKSKNLKWIPVYILVVATIIAAAKTYFFPGEGMAGLGDIVIIMMLGVLSIGSLVGGVILSIVQLQKNK